MKPAKRLYLWIFISCLLGAPAIAHGPGPHVHGVASLQVALDGNTLTLHLESPLDNLLGFEHSARTEKEKGAVRDMAARLNKADTLIAPAPEAQCKTVSVHLESPVLQPEKAAASGGHADLDGDFVFRCEHPEILRRIDVTLFDGFPNLRQIDVQVATSIGQAAARLTQKQRRVSW